MENSATGIFGLKRILFFQDIKNIIAVANWQMSGVGIIRRRAFFFVSVFIGHYNIRIKLFVFFGKTISGAFSRRGFQIIKLIILCLILTKALEHEVHDFGGKLLAFLGA